MMDDGYDWEWVVYNGVKTLVMDTPRGFSVEVKAVRVFDDAVAMLELVNKEPSSSDLWFSVNSAARLVEIPKSLHHTAVATLIAPHLVHAKRPWKHTAEGWVLKVKDPSIKASDTPQTIHIKNIWVWANEHGSGVSLGDYEAVFRKRQLKHFAAIRD